MNNLMVNESIKLEAELLFFYKYFNAKKYYDKVIKETQVLLNNKKDAISVEKEYNALKNKLDLKNPDTILAVFPKDLLEEYKKGAWEYLHILARRGSYYPYDGKLDCYFRKIKVVKKPGIFATHNGKQDYYKYKVFSYSNDYNYFQPYKDLVNAGFIVGGERSSKPWRVEGLSFPMHLRTYYFNINKIIDLYKTQAEKEYKFDWSYKYEKDEPSVSMFLLGKKFNLDVEGNYSNVINNLYKVSNEIGYSSGVDNNGLYTLVKMADIVDNVGANSIGITPNGVPYVGENKKEWNFYIEEFFTLYPFEDYLLDKNISLEEFLRKKYIELVKDKKVDLNKANKMDLNDLELLVMDIEEKKNNLEVLKEKSELELIPEFYQKPEVIEKMLFLYMNRRANNIMDLVNVYEQTQWQEAMLNSMKNLGHFIINFEKTLSRNLSIISNQINELTKEQEKSNAYLSNIQSIEMYNAKQLMKVNDNLLKIDDSLQEVNQSIKELDLSVVVNTSTTVNTTVNVK